jgi:hypothetical protein
MAAPQTVRRPDDLFGDFARFSASSIHCFATTRYLALTPGLVADLAKREHALAMREYSCFRTMTDNPLFRFGLHHGYRKHIELPQEREQDDDRDRDSQ